MVEHTEPSSQPSVVGDTTQLEAPGPSRMVSAADKWVKPNGPPVGVSFGARRLQEDQDVWQHNAWDHVTLPQDYLEKAAGILEFQRSNPVKEHLRDQYNTDPAQYWDQFYTLNQAAFFKDRAWLRSEFPELIACSEADAGPKIVLEVGCGAGNSIFTLMNHNENPDLTVFATDYSKLAVETVKANPMYPTPSHGKGKIKATVWDITAKPTSTSPEPDATLNTSSRSSASRPPASCFSLPEGVQSGTVDVITVIYVLSALHPNEWEQAVHNLYTALKPGGLLLLRDYGRHDLAQIRIKRERLLDPAVPNLYIRGDGTRVYFFEKEDVRDLLVAPPRNTDGTRRDEMSKGVENEANEGVESKIGEGSRGMFETVQLDEDRRMIVNRKERLQMYRIWLQVKARKLGGQCGKVVE